MAASQADPRARRHVNLDTRKLPMLVSARPRCGPGGGRGAMTLERTPDPNVTSNLTFREVHR